MTSNNLSLKPGGYQVRSVTFFIDQPLLHEIG